MTGRRADVAVLTGGELLIGRRSVPWVAGAIEREARALRRMGVRDADVERIAAAAADATRRVRTSDAGTRNVPIEAEPSSSDLVDPISVQQAAAELGCGDRNVIRLCSAGVFLSARRQGGRWRIERADVLARRERKVVR